MNMRREGFRKVRNQVCKRVRRRLRELKINDYEDYGFWLEVNPQEWKIVDQMTHITISRNRPLTILNKQTPDNPE